MSVRLSNSFLAAGIHQLEMFGIDLERGRVTPFCRVGQELLRGLLELVEDVESKLCSLIPVVCSFFLRSSNKTPLSKCTAREEGVGEGCGFQKPLVRWFHDIANAPVNEYNKMQPYIATLSRQPAAHVAEDFPRSCQKQLLEFPILPITSSSRI